jgi:hypothetical protein
MTADLRRVRVGTRVPLEVVLFRIRFLLPCRRTTFAGVWQAKIVEALRRRRVLDLRAIAAGAVVVVAAEIAAVAAAAKGRAAAAATGTAGKMTTERSASGKERRLRSPFPFCGCPEALPGERSASPPANKINSFSLLAKNSLGLRRSG